MHGGYFRHMRTYPKSQEELDRDLVKKCEKLKEHPTFAEFVTSCLCFRSVFSTRLADIERNLKKGASPNKVLWDDQGNKATAYLAAIDQAERSRLVVLLKKHKADSSLLGKAEKHAQRRDAEIDSTLLYPAHTL